MTGEQKMKTLLSENQGSTLAAECLAEADRSLVSLRATRPIPKQQIRGIYRLRSERNERLGNPIKGFAELMVGIDAAVTEEIIVHTLQTSQNTFILFSDADSAILVGILRLPPETHKRLATANPEARQAVAA